MDKDTRNTLRNVVTNCRRLLEEAVAQVLEGQYGVYASGRVEDASRMGHLSPDELTVREQIVTHLEHIRSGGFKPADAADQLIREIAFTHLNRLAAYKMMEQRGLIREAVSRGVKSQGFMFYLADHPDDERLWSTGRQELAYRHFLVWQGEQFADEISVLFSPYDPANFVFPPQRVLDQVLELINSAELADIWTADETIGWVYQYFTPKELRDKARKESQAPRNSYELAFRNQFYTPRYVVEFLTDNTLGRTWYEMQQGDTALIDRCQYLVRRPKEIFLAQGEDAPENDIDTSTLSQEELLQQPVYIPYRALKDPRRLKVLDPACGSGHFLLYAFDLLAIIYEEAWERGLTDQELGMSLRDDYATLKDLRCDIPRLILRNNLHGIDIDRRATQIAALALWLRAQRYYNDHSLDRKDRPAITQGNIVLAEPMPGDRALLDEFVAELEPPIDQMVKRVFNEMKLAGEAGSLLKIEEAIQDDIARAREEWERRLRQQHTPQQMALLPEWIEKKPEQLALFDVSKITDAEFFDRAEQLVLEALEAYAKRVENGHGLRRRLFADDAAGGFAFIEALRKHYDVVLMNPPFGAPSTSSKGYLAQNYQDSWQDIFACFVGTGVSLLAFDGLCGAITNRTGFFIVTQEKWRQRVILGESNLRLFVDLGYGVLDEALVEAAIYTIQKNIIKEQTTFHRAVIVEDKANAIRNFVHQLQSGSQNNETHLKKLDTFKVIPSHRIAFWIPDTFLRVFSMFKPYGDHGGIVAVGLQTSDNFRFLRLAWEVLPSVIGHSRQDTFEEKGWVFYAKGGEYSAYYGDIHLVVSWANDGHEIKGFTDSEGKQISYPRNERFYFEPGLTYSERTTSNFSARVFPGGCCFDTKGPLISKLNAGTNLADLAIFMSRSFAYLLEFMVGSADVVYSGSAARDYTPRSISELPFPEYSDAVRQQLASISTDLWHNRCSMERIRETDRYFVVPWGAHGSLSTCIVGTAKNILYEYETNVLNVLKYSQHAENVSRQLYGLDEQAISELEYEFGIHPLDFETREIDESAFQEIYHIPEDRIIDSFVQDTQGKRYITKKSYYADRKTELISSVLEVNAHSLISKRRNLDLITTKLIQDTATNVISYTMGSIFGRWDIRYATGERPIPELPDPFDPLPVCPPGMLQNADGLPATETPPSYPIDIDWDGILVDDPDHPDDIVRRMRGVLEVLWGDRAEAIEQEACEILGVKTLRDYFRKPGSGGFWDDHVKRYSKSRRKAPIYWLLQSSRKNYALWLYYHRLDKDLYYKALINYVQPKLRLERSKLDALRAQLQEAGVAGREAKRLEREVEQQEALMSELQDFHDALERAAQLNLVPDLNDGVVLNIAPLHDLVPWKEADKYWKALLKGEYEWSTISQQLRDKGLVK